MSKNTKSNQSNPLDQDTLFEQFANITKAHGYDILVEQVKEIQEARRKLLKIAKETEELNRELVEALQSLINVAKKETSDLIGWDGAEPLDAAIDKANAILEKANSINQ